MEIIKKEDIRHADVYALAAIGAYGGALANKYIPQYAGTYTVAVTGIAELIGGFVIMPYSKPIGALVVGAGVFSILDGVFRIFAPAYAV